jgi:hypothetical protein
MSGETLLAAEDGEKNEICSADQVKLDGVIDDNNTDNEESEEVEEVDYEKSKDYWATQPATVDGMLGGFEYISNADIEQSQVFLNTFLNVRDFIFRLECQGLEIISKLGRAN